MRRSAFHTLSVISRKTRSPVIIPEIQHRLAEMLDDVRAVEVNIFNERTTVFAVEDDVFFFSRRAAPLDYDADRVSWTLRRVRNVWRDEECFPFFDDMIDNAV